MTTIELPTREDEQWVKDQLSSMLGIRDILLAALQRGRRLAAEKAEVRINELTQEICVAHQVLDAARIERLDAARIERRDEIGERTLAGRIVALRDLAELEGKAVRDRDSAIDSLRSQLRIMHQTNTELSKKLDMVQDGFDAAVSANARLETELGRLTKRCEELEGETASMEANAIAAQARADYEAGENVDRLTALVEALYECFAEPRTAGDHQVLVRRLAALRAPRVATSPMDAEVLYQKVWDALKDVPTGGKFHAYEVVADVVAALATARREREEALGVVREVARVEDDGDGLPCWCHQPYPYSALVRPHKAHCHRARALLAGQPVVDPRDAEIETLRARVGGARWLLATAHITESLTPKGWLNKRSAWLDADLRARGEVPR